MIYRGIDYESPKDFVDACREGKVSDLSQAIEFVCKFVAFRCTGKWPENAEFRRVR